MRPLVYAMPGNAAFAAGLAAAWPADLGPLDVHPFPDGESLVRLGVSPAGRDVALVCTLHDPDAQVLPLLFAAGTARSLGARSVGLVAPYLAYMRQDKRFHAGEAVSAVHFAEILSGRFDWLTTVDPHLHRVRHLGEIYSIPTRVVPAAASLARWVVDHVERPLLVGPDEESRQWVAQVADAAWAPYVILEKHRSGDRTVELRQVDLAAWRHCTPVLVDDIISSAGTLIEATRSLREQGLAPPICLAVHAVFAPLAYWGLLEAGAAKVVTANTIEHASNAIDLSADVARACRELIVAPRASAA